MYLEILELTNCGGIVILIESKVEPNDECKES